MVTFLIDFILYDPVLMTLQSEGGKKGGKDEQRTSLEGWKLFARNFPTRGKENV